jgi:ATP-dependent 26S proteasome regulatory subunit
LTSLSQVKVRLAADRQQKRPSRFDRKYFFSDPDLDQRVAYCQYWQKKLKDNKDVEFPDKICKAVADITDGFSFAYIQEAFVAALLAIARRSDPEVAPGDRVVEDDWVALSDDEDDDLDKVALWVELKKQIGILREGMDEKS